MSEADKINEGLKPMFKEAKEKGLWFYCSYQGMWYSPEDLKKKQAEGQFMWGAVNWRLRDPKEKVTQLENSVKSAINELDNFKKRISG